LKSNTWINADPIPGAFVVNIGDMMERWTNGEWKSTLHRVIHKSESYRVSVPFFFEPDFATEVAPLKSCIRRTGGRKRWEPVVYGEHLVGKLRGNFYGG
jgi:isopenicillin N synthase-like dioxygenase